MTTYCSVTEQIRILTPSRPAFIPAHYGGMFGMGRTYLSCRPQPAATRPSQAVARNPEIEGEYDPARQPYGGAPVPGVQDAWGKQDLGISHGLDETFSHPVLAGGPRFVASGHHVDE